MEKTPHVLLAGERAVEFAADSGIETDMDLRTDRTRQRWADRTPPEGGPREQLDWIRDHFGDTAPNDHDTVGAVAADGDSIAAATSTGGRWLTLAGRVGDVPQIGSGFYCAPAGGASATGAGEDIARVTLSRRAIGLLEAGADAAEAADRAIEEFAELTDSTAGIIVCDGDGEFGSSFNSQTMQTKALARS